MNTKGAVKQKPYSAQSERLWENSPLCSETEQGFRHRIAYESEHRNAYGDPVFYKSEAAPNLARPRDRQSKIRLFNPKVNGFFRAYPGGLAIDQNTGEIDINGSDSGIRYTVEFTPCGKKCVARTNVIISGIGYEGGIFSLSGHGDLISKPYYFGDSANSREVPSHEVPAGSFGFIPSQTKPTANLKGLVIDPQTGMIDLRKTIESGALGFRENERFPENGTSKEFGLYYQLENDPSKGYLHKTSLRIHFFDTEGDIPEELKSRVSQQYHSIYRRALPLPLLLGALLTVPTDAPWVILAFSLLALSSLLLSNVTAKASNNPLRPPEHCVTR